MYCEIFLSVAQDTHLKYECPIEIYGFYASTTKSTSALPAGRISINGNFKEKDSPRNIYTLCISYKLVSHDNKFKKKSSHQIAKIAFASIATFIVCWRTHKEYQRNVSIPPFLATISIYLPLAFKRYFQFVCTVGIHRFSFVAG